MIKERLKEKGFNLDDLTDRERFLLDLLEEVVTAKAESAPAPSAPKEEPKETRPPEMYDYSGYTSQTYYNPYAPPPPPYQTPQYPPQNPAQTQQEMVQNLIDKYVDDPYLGDFVKALKKELDTLRTVTQLVGHDYLNFKRQAIQMANDLEFRRIQRERYMRDKEEYKFLPELTKDELVKIAQQKGINTWDGAYDAWLAEKVRENWVNYKKQMEDNLRKEVMQSQPPPTEVSGRNVVAPEFSRPKQEETKDWDQLWYNKLAKEFEKLSP